MQTKRMIMALLITNITLHSMGDIEIETFTYRRMFLVAMVLHYFLVYWFLNLYMD